MPNYKESGIDIDKVQSTLSQIKSTIEDTYTSAVLSKTGNFGGLFSLATNDIKPENAILVSSIDGVGTKTEVAVLAKRFENIGRDIVAHSVNDILVHGARPLFFLDYFASSQIKPAQLIKVIEGAAKACKEVNCILLGGETAEMPGVYNPGSLDLVGAIVGLTYPEILLPRNNIEPGDWLLGLPSSGLHTNGYTLARKLMLTDTKDINYKWQELGGQSTADALLKPHISYFNELWQPIKHNRIKALVHITGGGFYDNIPRILPKEVGGEIDATSWKIPKLFKLLVKLGNLSTREAFRTFNMGIGMVIIASKAQGTLLLNNNKNWKKIGRCITGNGIKIKV